MIDWLLTERRTRTGVGIAVFGGVLMMATIQLGITGWYRWLVLLTCPAQMAIGLVIATTDHDEKDEKTEEQEK